MFRYDARLPMGKKKKSLDGEVADPLYLASDRVYALVLFEVFVAFLIVLFEFLDNIRADIRKLLLDSLRNSHRVLCWDHALAALSEQVLDKRGQVAASNGDALDGGANNITFSLAFQDSLVTMIAS